MFKSCCFSKQSEFAKQLYSIWEISEDTIISTIEISDSLPVFEWLISLGEFDIVSMLIVVNTQI